MNAKTLLACFCVALLAAGLFGFAGTAAMNDTQQKPTAGAENTKTAVFAGGCFWCTEADFEKVDGVVEAVSGYTGGRMKNPTYKQVSSGGTRHVEAVRVFYDPAVVDYEKLLWVFWRTMDPTDPGGQFVDRGNQYTSAIFYADEEQKRLAEASKRRLAENGPFDKPIVTEIRPLDVFYRAEEYHQDYYKKNPMRYGWYRSGSGRDRFLKASWDAGPKEMIEKLNMEIAGEGSPSMDKTSGMAPAKTAPSTGMKAGPDKGEMQKAAMGAGATPAMSGWSIPGMSAAAVPASYTKPDDRTLKERLSPMQYKVTQQDGTEPPFQNPYWDNKKEGIYVDIVSGEPLFSSTDKFKSGTGWPSFIRPLEPENIVEKADRSYFMVRTEVRSRHANSHLGHVFEDGPAPTGLRYCINSAALDFIPKEQLEEKGYGKYLTLFK